MKEINRQRWRHDHTFGQDQPMPGERRTLIVIVITGAMMVVEIIGGVAFGSMALLADGLHMASHTVALAIAYFAYIFARRHARDERYSFGTGKVNSLGGFTGAVLLAVFALGMAWESFDRFLHPVSIKFNQAILVAVLGLVVNAVCAVILEQEQDEESTVEDPIAETRSQPGGEETEHHPRHHDHNLRSAYLHVVADALTSLLAIFALLTGKYVGALWLDPTMGVVGAVLVARWSVGLIRVTSHVLLDRQAPERIRNAIRLAIEADGAATVTDLHVWAIGPGKHAAIIGVVTETLRSADEVKARLPRGLQLAHVTVELNGVLVEETREVVSSRAR
ncbi:MAG: CDF family Co(II)/Ni(II) efflux transporter DmeF [Phycisphaerales bacterium]|nr:MAG: CDF family Co(II)/Ni(II) efflux transporter DmeF [Phycisphaerales bacterium]